MGIGEFDCTPTNPRRPFGEPSPVGPSHPTPAVHNALPEQLPLLPEETS